MFTWLINKLFENLTFEYRLSLKIEEQIRNWELYKEKQYFFQSQEGQKYLEHISKTMYEWAQKQNESNMK